MERRKEQKSKRRCESSPRPEPPTDLPASYTTSWDLTSFRRRCVVRKYMPTQIPATPDAITSDARNPCAHAFRQRSNPIRLDQAKFEPETALRCSRTAELGGRKRSTSELGSYVVTIRAGSLVGHSPRASIAPPSRRVRAAPREGSASRANAHSGSAAPASSPGSRSTGLNSPAACEWSGSPDDGAP